MPFHWLLQGILQQLFNATDIAVVGRFTGSMASVCMAAVGTNTPIVGLIVNLFVGISMGSNVVVATAAGEGDEEMFEDSGQFTGRRPPRGRPDGSRRRAGQSCRCFSPRMCQRPHALAAVYLRIYFAGMPVILLYNFSVYRGKGNTKTPLIALTISGSSTYSSIFSLSSCSGMNVDGVAIATVISSAVQCGGFLFVGLCRKNGAVAVRPRDLRPDGRILSRIMRIGIPTKSRWRSLRLPI